MAAIFVEQGIEQWPLFIHYGQLSAVRELESCRTVCQRLGLRQPMLMDVQGYGAVIDSGLTNPARDVFLDAFTPGRNLLFLTLAASYGFRFGSRAIAIGLLRKDTCLFPDQTDTFILNTEHALSSAMGTPVEILMPLRQFAKVDVINAAARLGVSGTYSCHKGMAEPCGICVACREYRSVS